MEETPPLSKLHKLNSTWTLWAHLPHDIDWSIQSYKKITDLHYIEDTVILMESLPIKMIKNCMLFLMRKDIMPMWEDVNNKEGGSFSYKVSNKNISKTWCNLCYALVGEQLAKTGAVQNSITGITISPKKNFCVIKIWLSKCDKQDPNIINNIVENIQPQGCLFKRHNPKY